VPTAAAQLAADMFPTALVDGTTLADRPLDGVARGGRLGEREVPELIASDMRDLFRTLR
jgi:hypothetical protein